MIIRELFTRLGFDVDATKAKEYEGVVARIKDKSQLLYDTTQKTSRGLRGMLSNLRGGMAGIAEGFGVVTNALSSAVGVLGLGIGAAGLVQMTAAWTDYTSRIQMAIGANGDAVAAMDQLRQMALTTYTPLEQTIEAYLGASQSLKDLGLNAEQSMAFVTSFNNAMVVSGAKGDRATSVMNAMTKAMAGGVLRGDELNTIIENGGPIAQKLAEKLHTTVAGLRPLGEKGVITSKMLLQVFTENHDLWAKQAADMPATILDALTNIRTAFMAYVGVRDQAFGVSGKIADGLIWLSNHIGIVAFAVSSILVVALMGLVVWVHNTTIAFGLLTVALLANPLTWIVLGIAAAVAALVLVGQDLWTWMNGGESVIGGLIGSFKEFKTTLSNIVHGFIDPIRKGWADFLAALRDHDFGRALEIVFEAALATIKMAFQTLWAISLPGIVARFAPDLFKPITDKFFSILEEIKAAWNDTLNTLADTMIGRGLRWTFGGVDGTAADGTVRVNPNQKTRRRGGPGASPSGDVGIVPNLHPSSFQGSFPTLPSVPPAALSPASYRSEGGGVSMTGSNITVNVAQGASGSTPAEIAETVRTVVNEENTRYFERMVRGAQRNFAAAEA